MQNTVQHGTFFQMNHDDYTHPRHLHGFYYESQPRPGQHSQDIPRTQFIPSLHNQKFGGATFLPRHIDAVSPTPSTSTDNSIQSELRGLPKEHTRPPCPFSSRKLLFLDVDGVILPQNSSTPLDEQYDMENRLTAIEQSTRCDIIVSSSWQFDPDYMNDLAKFLGRCGFEPSRVHTLLDILPGLSKEEYEQAPYCQSRARGILQAVDFYSAYIDAWIVLDDLPLSSSDFVTVPYHADARTKAGVIAHVILTHANAYFVDAQNVAGWFNRVESQVQGALRARTIGKSDRVSKKGREWLAGLFSKHACRFGWKATGSNIRTQARFICKCVDLTEQLPEELCGRLVEAIIGVITEYVTSSMSVMGEIEIEENFLQTDMFCGLTDDQTNEAIFSLVRDYRR